MYLPRSLFSRNSDSVASEQCELVSSTVPICVRDLIVVAGCLVVFCLFAFWVVPRICRTRCRNACADGKHGKRSHDPFHDVSPMNDSLLVKHGIVPFPSKPEKVRMTDVPRMSTTHHLEPTPDLKYDLSLGGDPPPYTLPSYHELSFVSPPKFSSPRTPGAMPLASNVYDVYDTGDHYGELRGDVTKPTKQASM